MPDTAAVPELNLLDLDRLSEWMDAQGLESGPIVEPRFLSGGTQNIIVKFRRGRSEFVLRRPSAHPRTNSNKTMEREAEVLRALAGSDVPHPALIAGCTDTDVLGAAFYLMEPVEGFYAPGGMPALHSGDSAVRHRMGLALAEGAATLGAVDYLKAGLEHFGKPDGFLERQTARWRSQLESYSEYPEWLGPGTLEGVKVVEDWLERNLPLSSYRPGIIHGDFHIANVLYKYDSPELAAILDWELATIGDPLLDLGWILATWLDEKGQLTDPAIAITPSSGFPTPAELIAHYGRFTTRDMSVVPWYVVLACYKLGIILEGTHARACAGQAEPEIGDRLHHSAVLLFRRALEWIGRA